MFTECSLYLTLYRNENRLLFFFRKFTLSQWFDAAGSWQKVHIIHKHFIAAIPEPFLDIIVELEVKKIV